MHGSRRIGKGQRHILRPHVAPVYAIRTAGAALDPAHDVELFAFVIGGVKHDMPQGFAEAAREMIPKIRELVSDYDGVVTRNRIFVDRLKGTGVISKWDCIDYAVTGPILRSAGVPYDIRKDQPYSGYEGYDFEVPVGTTGDCFDRYLVRMEEMRQSNRIIKQCVDWLRENPGPVMVEDRKVAPPAREEMKQDMEALIHHFKLFTSGFKVPVGESYQAIESPRGELGMYIVPGRRRRCT